MIKRVIGICILVLGVILGGYFSIYFSAINKPAMLLTLSLLISFIFLIGIYVLVLDSKERETKKQKKIVLEMIKKTRVAQERQNYYESLDELRKKRIY